MYVDSEESEREWNREWMTGCEETGWVGRTKRTRSVGWPRRRDVWIAWSRPVVSRYARLVGDIVFGSVREPGLLGRPRYSNRGPGERQRELSRVRERKGEKVVAGVVVGRLAVLCRMLPGSEYLLLRCRVYVGVGEGGWWRRRRTVVGGVSEGGMRRGAGGGQAEWPCAQ